MIRPSDPDHHYNIDAAALFESLSRQTHASTAMVLSARLEQVLRWVVENHMPNASNRLKARLFEGYGPLTHFSAKIDIAFALGLINGTTRQLLHGIREIRNEFAHSDDPGMSFDHHALTPLLQKLPIKKHPSLGLHQFTDAAYECVISLLRVLEAQRGASQKR